MCELVHQKANAGHTAVEKPVGDQETTECKTGECYADSDSQERLQF
jgi:hypothetical protein